MGAFFIKFSFSPFKGVRRQSDCIIEYNIFERVDSRSFYEKFMKKTKRYNEVEIESVTKL
jgi:hypothetical protein